MKDGLNIAELLLFRSSADSQTRAAPTHYYTSSYTSIFAYNNIIMSQVKISQSLNIHVLACWRLEVPVSFYPDVWLLGLRLYLFHSKHLSVQISDLSTIQRLFESYAHGGGACLKQRCFQVRQFWPWAHFSCMTSSRGLRRAGALLTV